MHLAFLIPTYNSSKYIIDSLNSIVESASDATNSYGVILSDNNSSDNTLELITGFSVDCPTHLKLDIHHQDVNLGCYGNLRFLQDNSPAKWNYILCSDDLLVPEAIGCIEREIIVATNIQCGLIAFRDQTITEVRERVEKLNCSPKISGRRGLAILFLYGCVVGGLSNVCLRNDEHGVNLMFDSRMKYYGDMCYYVDYLISGGAIYFSPLQTNIRRIHDCQISCTGNLNCDEFWETHCAIKKCIFHLAKTKVEMISMLAFAHSVLHFQHYRLAAKKAFILNFTPIKNIQLSCGHATTLPTIAWIFLSFFMVEPIREILRYFFSRYLLG